MAASLQVIYEVSDGSTFDYEYYTTKHFAIVDANIGEFITSQLVTKGSANAPDQPPSIHAIATFTFENGAALEAAFAAAGPVLEDLQNFTNVTPQMLIGEVIGT